MDVRVQVSENGGKTFYRMNESNKHSDNHSMTFKKNDPNYLLVGTDGGIYESFDDTESWKFVNRKAKVVSLPAAFKTSIKIGDTIIVHQIK